MMKKLINDKEKVLSESLAGFCKAHSDLVVKGEGFVQRKELTNGKVALVSGGGSGHEPLHAGFVGYGMLDVACPGEVFTSPTPDQMENAANTVDTGAGVLFIVKNYEGDVMNFEMGAEMFSGENVSIITDDDVAVEKSTYSTGRRGVAGTMVVEKIVGAAAEEKMNLADLKQLGDEVNAVTRSMGVALTSCTLPAVGTPTFEIGDDEIEMGVGIHGEPGRKRINHTTADEIVSQMISAITEDLGGNANGDALLLVNGFGGTPAMELYLVYESAIKELSSSNIKVARSLVGNYVTSLDMQGCSITLTMLNDKFTKYWDAAVHTPALRWGK